MNWNHSLRLVAPAALAVALMAGAALAQVNAEPAPADAPKADPAAVAPAGGSSGGAPASDAAAAAKPAEVSPEAQVMLDKLRDTYKNLTSLELVGRLTADLDIDGQNTNNSADFTASFAAPNKFRHEMKDDVLLGSTGEKIYARTRSRPRPT